MVEDAVQYPDPSLFLLGVAGFDFSRDAMDGVEDHRVQATAETRYVSNRLT